MSVPEGIQSVVEDLYGQSHPVETDEIIISSLKGLEDELHKIPPTEDKRALIMALEKCPDLCDDKVKLMFLRAEVFNADLAAKRIVNYWKKRLEIFGEDRAFLPLTLDGALKDDSVALQIGFMRLAGKDSSSRNIIFADPSRFEPDQYERLSMARSLWYYLHAALEDETTQQKGIILLGYAKKAKFSQLDRKLMAINAESVKACLPIRMTVIHMCHPPTFFKVVFPLIKILLGKRLKKRILVHSGSEEAVLAKLEVKYGISRDNIPTELGGEFIVDHVSWLEERGMEGK